MLVGPYRSLIRSPDVAATGLTYATLNPSDKGPSITLSGSNLIATLTTADRHSSVRSTISKSSGKWYYEATMTAGATYAPGYGIGVANSSFTVDNVTPGGNNDAFLTKNGTGNHAGGGITGIITSVPYSVGDVVACRFDVDAETIGFNNITTATGWFEGTISTMPASAWYACISLVVTNDAITANFGPTFAGAVPSGYAALTA